MARRPKTYNALAISHLIAKRITAYEYRQVLRGDALITKNYLVTFYQSRVYAGVLHRNMVRLLGRQA